MAKEFSMGPGTIPVGQIWMCIKKIWFAGIMGMLLCLLPSVAYAHDMSGFVFFPIGVMFLQIVYGIYMLFLKKKEMAGHYLVVSVLYVGILGLLWLGVLLGFRGVVDYLESVGSTLSYLISMVGYWIVFPLGTAPIVAWGLYRRFRVPLPATETSQSYKDA